jgi:hypothetical protein
MANQGRTPTGTDGSLLTSSVDALNGRGYRVSGAGELEYQCQMDIDGPEGSVYILDGGTNRQPLYRPFFEPLYLWPGQINRMRMVISSGSFPMELDTAWQAKCEIRYRRLTL